MAAPVSAPLQRISSMEIDPGKVQALFELDSKGRAFYISSVHELSHEKIQGLITAKLAYLRAIEAFKTKRKNLKAAYVLAPSLERDLIDHYQQEIDDLKTTRTELNMLIDNLGVLFIDVK